MQTLNVSLKVEGLLLHLRMQGLNPSTTCGRTELTHGAALFRMTATIPGLLFIGRLCVVSTPSVTMPTRRAKKKNHPRRRVDARHGAEEVATQLPLLA